MSNQPDVIGRYLDQVCGYLQMMPEDDGAEIRRELREHLHLSVEDLIANGLDPAAAPGEATRRFGRAQRVGLDIAMKSPYAWMWKRADDDNMSLSIVSSTISGIGMLAALGYVSVAWVTHRFLSLPIWLVAFYVVLNIAQGWLNGMSSIVRQAGDHDFATVSRQVATAIRSTNKADLPRWKQKLGLDRLVPAFEIALPVVDRPRLYGMWYVNASFGAFMLLCLWELQRNHWHTTRYGIGYLSFYTASGFGQAVGEAACIAYYRHRRRLSTSKGKAGNG